MDEQTRRLGGLPAEDGPNPTRRLDSPGADISGRCTRCKGPTMRAWFKGATLEMASMRPGGDAKPLDYEAEVCTRCGLIEFYASRFRTRDK